MKKPTAPKHLKRAGADFWRRVQSEYQINDAAGLALLTTAAESLDRTRAAQAAIVTHGEMVLDRYGQLKTNPACTLERDSRVGFLAALRQLNLDVEPLRDAPGRPPGWS